MFSAGDNIHLKILVPSIAAGAIIGKGGETIAQVQKESGARVKMSKANDFYPGKIYCKIIYYFEFHMVEEVKVLFWHFSMKNNTTVLWEIGLLEYICPWIEIM